MASNYVLQFTKDIFQYGTRYWHIYPAVQADLSVQGVIQQQSQAATGLFCHAVKNCVFIVVENSAFWIATNVLC